MATFIIDNGVLISCISDGETHLEIPAGVKRIGAAKNYATVIRGVSSNKVESLVIPEGVTEIACSALYGLTNLKRVTLPSTLEVIEYAAFGLCRALEDVVLPAGLRVIGDRAFTECDMISRLNLPSSLEKIGEFAFYNCKTLQEVTGMHSGIAMGEAAFGNCGKLADEDGFVVLADTLFGYFGNATEVTIPDSVQRIAGPVFVGKANLTSVHIPAHITTLGASMFERCKALTAVELPPALEKIPRTCFSGCDSLTRIELPKTVKVIEPYAFTNCVNLAEVILPEGLKTIGNNAFNGCNALEEVVIPGSVRELLGFCNCEKLHKINIPAKLKKIDNFEGCKKITWLPVSEKVELPYSGFRKNMLILHSGLYESPWKAKEENRRLWYESTTLFSIGKDKKVEYKLILHPKFEKLVAFDKKGVLNWKVYDALLCGGDLKLSPPFGSLAMLYRLRYPNELEESRKATFIETVCKDVKKLAPFVNLCPEDGLVALLEEIGALTAKNKKTLLPLMGIGEAPAPKKKAEKKPAKESAEPGVKTPAQIRKEWGTKKLADGTLWLTSYKGADTEVEVPTMIGTNKVTVVGDNCFSCDPWSTASKEVLANRRKITSVVIPEGITAIGEAAFSQMPNLEIVQLPATLKTIGLRAFQNCPRLKSINVPADAEVGDHAFSSCKGLADEAGLAIVNGVLYGCYKGGHVVIPDRVKKVTSNVFSSRNDIQSVEFPHGLTSLPNYTFYECTGIQSVTVPYSVIQITADAFVHTRTTVRGYTGSEVENCCRRSYGNLKFESIGEMPKGVSDFVVADGVLVEYKGEDTDVTIPADVTALGSKRIQWDSIGAFQGNKTIERVVIPEGVTRIEGGVFQNCTNLSEIQFPDSLVYVEGGYYNALSGTRWLADAPAGPVYAGRVLYSYKKYENPEEAPETLVVRDGTKMIANSALRYQKHLKKIVLPKGLERIESEAFAGCEGLEEMVVPVSVTEIGDQLLGYSGQPPKRCSGGVLHKTTKLPAKFKLFYTGDPVDTAWVNLYQGETSWRKAVRERMDEQPENVTPALMKMAELINAMDVLDKGVGNRAATFAQELCKVADGESLKAVYEALKAKNHPMAKKLDEDQAFKACMEGGIQEDLSKLHPMEAKVVQNLKFTPAFDRVVSRIISGVPYAGTEEICSPRVLAFIVYEYIKQYDPESVKYVSEYQYTCKAYEFSPVADEVAAALDQTKLQEALWQLAGRYEGEYYLPYARYADEKNTVSLVSQIRNWDNWSIFAATGRKHIIIARSGLLLNDTKAAMIYLDKVGALGKYAALRGTDAETLRDTVLAEFGFDENREIRYDLGGNTVVVSMDNDLNLTIFDTNAGKTVKSIPKKGADAALHEKAKTEFSELKKNIKKVITNRKHLLFGYFLGGREKDAASWKKTYIGNPVLNSVARLVVWMQGGKTFTLTIDGAVDCNGEAYTITDEPIIVAHPIEMREEVKAWQDYFTSRGLKQPFEQVWEPAYNPDDIKPDRYSGSKLNVYRLTHKEDHGITVWGLQAYSEDYGFNLADCKMEYEGSEWRFVNGITDDATFTLGKFTIEKFSRRANHIVYLFDKWTITDRLLKDDTSVEPLLAAFTAAQIREFVHLTTEKGCTNCAAMLLNYQNRNFADLDPLAEFTLDL